MCSRGESPAPAGTVPHARAMPASPGHSDQDLGVLLLLSGMDLSGKDLGRGRQRSALPDNCSRVDSVRGQAAAGFANAAA